MYIFENIKSIDEIRSSLYTTVNENISEIWSLLFMKLKRTDEQKTIDMIKQELTNEPMQWNDRR